MARALRIPKIRLPAPKILRLPKIDEPYEDVFETMTLAALRAFQFLALPKPATAAPG